MNREFRMTSTWTRIASACSAVLATALIAASIDGLIVHYSPNSQVASAEMLMLARH